ncbi:MAG TPA: NYN domain-containing protein [Candidatus Saccharimonadia bacterium]|jgi:uncharacterized LabA/DUF88 family protein
MKVYVDGENFIHSLTDVLRRHKKIASRQDVKAFDIAGLCSEALGVRDPEILYYTTKLREAEEETHGKEVADKSKEIIAWVAGWNTMLMEQGVTVVRAGHLKIREAFPCPECGHIRHVFQEKGVDVRLAVDIVQEAIAPQADVGGEQVNMAVFSSDSDLIPAVHAVRAKGLRVKNLAPSEGLNLGLARSCGEWQLITDDQFLKAFTRAKRKLTSQPATPLDVIQSEMRNNADET